MKPIHFEYQVFNNFTLVALDSKLSDYEFQPVYEHGNLVMKAPAKTIKDCTNIDGCVYLHLGQVDDSVMVDLIEKFNKLKKEKGWKRERGLIVPDNQMKIE